MDIVSAFNAPRRVQLAGNDYWVRAMTLADYAVLYGWLDDVLPGRSDRDVPPNLSDGCSLAAVGSIDGRTLLLWLAIRQAGGTYDEAAGLLPLVKEEEYSRLLQCLFERRRTKREAPSWAEEDPVGWWGPLIASLLESRNYTIAEVGSLTLDQVELIAEGGCEVEHPGYLTVDDVQRMWEAAQAADDEGGTA